MSPDPMRTADHPSSRRVRPWSLLRIAVALASLLILASAVAVAPAAVKVLDLAGHYVDPFGAHRARATVFIFIRSDCPISNRYAPEIERLDQEFAPQGVVFWLVYVDPRESVDAIRKHLREYGYHLSALRDSEHELVKMTGVEVTPEAAVFVPARTDQQMVYRGRIDDRYVDFGKSRPAPTTRDLEQILQQIIDGKAVKPETTHAIGCFISDLK